MNLPTVQLKKGREHSLLRHHPWVFSGAVASVHGSPMPGDTVNVLASNGAWLARGAFSPASEILVRIWSFHENDTIDADFFRQRIADAVALRSLSSDPSRNALRLVHGESDGLPGVIADRYDSTIVFQLSTTGAEHWRAEIIDALRAAVPDATSLYERSDSPARSHEGLEPTCGLRFGPEPPERILASWAGLSFSIPIRTGHKTGSYLDQAETLPRIAPYAHNADVLDAFCYTGGFTLTALRAGASSVTALDSSENALAELRDNVSRNALDASRLEILCDDAFKRLRRFRDERRSFDLIILDPPKFADSRGAVERACRAYKDINLLAFKLLRPGGTLATFSCSGSVGPELFQKVIADAALDAHRFARILTRFSQASDHPISLAFPEGSYLKGLLCKVN